jgi:hypothetical protein
MLKIKSNKKFIHIVALNHLRKILDPIVETAYTGCPRRKVPDFGRVFLMLKYTDITQNTYVQS